MCVFIKTSSANLRVLVTGSKICMKVNRTLFKVTGKCIRGAYCPIATYMIIVKHIHAMGVEQHGLSFENH